MLTRTRTWLAARVSSATPPEVSSAASSQGPAQRREALALTALFAALFATTGVALPFLPVWIAGLGLDPQIVALLLTLPILVRIAATAPLAGLVDRGFSPRRIVAAGSLAVAASFALMPLAADVGWPVLALLVAVNAVAQAPLVPLCDYLALALVRRAPGLAYARIRLGGSLGFLAASLAAGWWLQGRAEGGIVWLLAGTAALGALLAPALPRGGVTAAAPVSPVATAPRAASTTALRFAVLGAAASQAGHAAIYAFGTLHWRGLGIGSDVIGVYWATGVVAEIGLFALVGALPRWRERPFPLLALGALAGLLRWPALALVGDRPATILALQVLHGLTFGATQLGAMAALSRYAPEGARGRAQGRLGAAVALASAAATLASGAAYRAGGGPLALALMAPLSAAALICALAMRAADRADGAPSC